MVGSKLFPFQLDNDSEARIYFSYRGFICLKNFIQIAFFFQYNNSQQIPAGPHSNRSLGSSSDGSSQRGRAGPGITYSNHSLGSSFDGSSQQVRAGPGIIYFTLWKTTYEYRI